MTFSGDVGAYELLGEGSRRRCYRMPEPGLCVKFYRKWGEFTARDGVNLRFSVCLARHRSALNVNCHECRYHSLLKRRLSPDLFSIFPERVTCVYSPDRGWGVVESLIQDADGRPSQRIESVIYGASSVEQRERLFAAAERLLQRLAEEGVCFFDPHNILVQWVSPAEFRLRIADFDPQDRVLVPGLTCIKPYVRLKVLRRARRFLVRIRKRLQALEQGQ